MKKLQTIYLHQRFENTKKDLGELTKVFFLNLFTIL